MIPTTVRPPCVGARSWLLASLVGRVIPPRLRGVFRRRGFYYPFRYGSKYGLAAIAMSGLAARDVRALRTRLCPHPPGQLPPRSEPPFPYQHAEPRGSPRSWFDVEFPEFDEMIH